MIQATIHQGHSKFQANGTQCMANAVAAVVESYNTPLKSWSQEILDYILERDDLLYAQHGDASQKYFMKEDLKSECDGFYHAINFGTAFTGSTMDNERSYPFFTLEQALGACVSVYSLWEVAHQALVQLSCITKTNIKCLTLTQGTLLACPALMALLLCPFIRVCQIYACS
ncbi:hypothetical protein DPMN_164104 [Dreissena polymorpha]|uniref:Uncharacterized protein n=1 Tax=Dreissena polymorpha TaxID=45954 RepID=A0A9D4IS17_DREPO|nr:hypothetical protein DPMN_164104 [Dreissena polymorpha]